MGLNEELSAHVGAVRGTVAGSSAVISEIVARLSACFEQGGKLLVCGNGGSAADAQHLAAEFMNRMRADRQPWPAIALSTDTSVLTSIANDAAYSGVFSRQVEALGRPGDVLIALSSSGGSANVLAALRAGRRSGMVTVGFTGEEGVERMGADCDLLLAVPSRDTARIQECHEFVYHFIAGAVETQLSPSPGPTSFTDNEVQMTGSAIGLDALLGSDWRQEVESRRSDITRRVAGRTDVLLFGAGYLGRHLRGDLEGLPFNPLAFVDNNAALWGSEIEGLEVLSPDAAAARFGQSALWLIAVYTNSRVIEQCRALAVPWVTCAELSWVLPEPHPPSLVFGIPERLADSAREIEVAASIWADSASEAEYRSQVRWRFLLDYAALATPRPIAEIYFPDDLIRPLANETFVDCGAFTGDTIEAFLAARAGRFEQIVGVEPDVLNGRALQDRIDDWSRSGIGPIRIEPVAVGSHRGTLRFETTGTAGSSVGSGADVVDVAPLDEILADCTPTYIKFDVEGAEHDALVGASAVIQADMPVLAVCLYHRPVDLWDLPLLIRSLGPDYRLYLRRYSDERWETVCYAVPVERLRP